MAEKAKVAKDHSKQVNLLSELIDKKIEVRVSGLESTVTKLFRLFKNMKQHSSPKKVAELEKGFNHLKEAMEDFNVKALEEDIFRKFAEFNRKLSHSVEGQNSVIENLEIEFSALRKSFEDFEVFGKELEEADIIALKRDVESLKTKAEWLELELSRLNTRPLTERVEELENRLRTMRIVQPTIIE